MSGANLLVTPAELAAETLRVEGERYRHLFRARRLAAGEPIRLVDGEGGARWAAVEGMDRRGAVLRLGGAAPAADPVRPVTLLVAVPRPDRAAWLVEKATELGVVAVRFLDADRGVRGLDAKLLARLERVAASALEQCGGARLPELSGPHPTAEVPRLLGGAPAVALAPGGAHPLSSLQARTEVVLVGPEGGWSAAELAGFGAAGVPTATLGERVLRVETAAVAAGALLLLSERPFPAARPGSTRPPGASATIER
jgi:16S rRNA (uracil1498-N3)-methyltransferase